jgi:hypothetical protein
MMTLATPRTPATPLTSLEFIGIYYIGIIKDVVIRLSGKHANLCGVEVGHFMI